METFVVSIDKRDETMETTTFMDETTIQEKIQGPKVLESREKPKKSTKFKPLKIKDSKKKKRPRKSNRG